MDYYNKTLEFFENNIILIFISELYNSRIIPVTQALSPKFLPDLKL